MTTSSSFNGSNSIKTNNWPARRWLLYFGGALVGWTILYLIAHSSLGIPGYERSGFTDADIRHVNSLLINVSADEQPVGAVKQRITNANDGFLDTYHVDSTESDSYLERYPENYTYSNLSAAEDRKMRVQRAMVYIRSQYGDDIDEAELTNIERYISTFTPRETGVFLADYHMKIHSFFWLTGAMVYAEVVCWVIFGVLCSLLLYTGRLVRKGNGNDARSQRNIIYQSARLFYAPFAAVMLVLVYSYLKGGAMMHVQVSEAIIIFAFLLGFYSGLVQDLADRLRGNNKATEPDTEEETAHAPAYSSHYAAPQEPYTPPPAPVMQEEQPTATDAAEEHVPQEPEDYDFEPVQAYPPVEQVKQKRRTVNADNEISEVDIDLKLDLSGLFDEERAQLQRLGFNRAIVTLHNVNGKDIIPAKKQEDNMTVFVATDVKPGIYIARATLSQRLRDDQIVNLFGEKTVYITEDKPGLELFVKKYEATD